MTSANRFNLIAPIAILVSNRYLLWKLVRRNMEMRYKSSVLGFCWSFIQPLLMLCVYTFVFSVVFNAKWGVGVGESRGAFAIIMFCGMALFSIFSESVNLSCGVVVYNPNYVKKVVFPLEVLPFAQVISSFILGMAWFILLFVGVLIYFKTLYWTMLLLPIILFPLLLFSSGISYFVSATAVYLRDTQYIIGVILQILFFVTPIFYSIEAVPEQFRWILQINPLSIWIGEARNIFLFGKMPSWVHLGISYLVSIAVFALGFSWFHKIKKGFANVL